MIQHENPNWGATGLPKFKWSYHPPIVHRIPFNNIGLVKNQAFPSIGKIGFDGTFERDTNWKIFGF